MIQPPYPPGIDADYAACIVSQRLVPADARPADLPPLIERKCCLHKNCGNTDLVLSIQTDPDTKQRSYGYVRFVNGDVYFKHRPLAELIDALNDRLYWPVDEQA